MEASCEGMELVDCWVLVLPLDVEDMFVSKFGILLPFLVGAA